MLDKGASHVPAVLPVFHAYEGEGIVKALVRRRTIDISRRGSDGQSRLHWRGRLVKRPEVVGKLFPDGGVKLLNSWKS